MPGISFFSPPFLKEIQQLVHCVVDLNQKKIILESVELEQLQQRFQSICSYYNVSNLLRNVYTPLECLAYCQEDAYLKAPYQSSSFATFCLSIGVFFKEIIPYDLLEVSKTATEKSKKILREKNSSTKDKIDAGRQLIYAAIPWGALQSISILLMWRSPEKQYPYQEIILSAARALRASWAALLPGFQALITYEVSVAQGTVNFEFINFPPLDPKDSFFCLAQYAADALYLRKIKATLSEF
ncbi:unnamed protein product, partial [marine sediment metagenome]